MVPALHAPAADDEVMTPELIEMGQHHIGQFWDPYASIPYLPERAPVRSLSTMTPTISTVRQRLQAVEIDPDRASAIITEILHAGWAFWLTGSRRAGKPRFRGNIIELRYGAVWASYDGNTPAEALGGALVLCLDEPPWERLPEPAD